MSDAIATELIRQGVLGTLLVGAMIVIGVLYRALEAERKKHIEDVDAVQRARIEDQKANQQMVLELTRTAVAAVSTGANASLANKEALAEVRTTIKEHNDALLDALSRIQPRR